MNKKKFLAVLPVFKGDIKIIAEDQSMTDIVSEVLEAHKIYQADYDQLITVLKMPPDLYEWLFEFCKKNVVYEVETIDLQTTRSPAGILEMGSGDCKHYASFIAGILDALVRDGYAIDWRYRFAEYKNSASSHVFIVVKENGKEIWIDPVLSYFDQRYPAPTSFFDKKVKSMALHRLSGVEPEPTQETAFVNDTIVTREQYQRQVKVAEACAGSGSAMGLVDFPIGKDGDFFPGGDQSGGGGGSTPPPVVYPRPFEGVQYLVNGAPLVFPSKGSRALIPSDLVIVFPQTYQGHPLPVDLPKPVVAGNRLVLLPKIAWNVRDQYAAFDYLWIKFIQSALTPLIQSYGQFPDWNQENLYFTIWDDTDRADVVDYISSKPVAMSFDWELLPEIKYFAGAEPLAFGPDRNYNGNDFNGSHPPPIIPDTLSVVYPDFYKGVAVPDSLPRPIMNAGKLQLQPHGFGVDNMRANYFMWHSFLVAVMTPLIRSFAQYPYTGNNDLTERVWNDIAKNEHLENYLVAPDRKTFLGQVIETLAGYVQEVTRLSLKVINAGSRLAFLGLVRINAFAFAYKLFLALNDDDRKDKCLNRWRDLGGNTGDFQKAIILGCKNNPVFGGGVKQWIEDAVQDGEISNGYVRPVDDAAIPEGQSMSGASMGIAGADDVVYYMAAASAIIAALGAFLKGVGGPETDKIVDDVIAGYDVLLTAAGEDPIGTGSGLGAPVVITDPATGQQYTLNPPVTSSENPIMKFIKANPMQTALIAAGVAGTLYLVTNDDKKRKRAHA